MSLLQLRQLFPAAPLTFLVTPLDPLPSHLIRKIAPGRRRGALNVAHLQYIPPPVEVRKRVAL
eukprot:5151516-Alexandrium_andersonii.AAC.1